MSIVGFVPPAPLVPLAPAAANAIAATGGVLGSAAAGAAAGSVLGPKGAVAGAAVGLGLGLMELFFPPGLGDGTLPPNPEAEPEPAPVPGTIPPTTPPSPGTLNPGLNDPEPSPQPKPSPTMDIGPDPLDPPGTVYDWDVLGQRTATGVTSRYCFNGSKRLETQEETRDWSYGASRRGGYSSCRASVENSTKTVQCGAPIGGWTRKYCVKITLTKPNGESTNLEYQIESEGVTGQGNPPFSDLYWDAPQAITHVLKGINRGQELFLPPVIKPDPTPRPDPITPEPPPFPEPLPQPEPEPRRPPRPPVAPPSPNRPSAPPITPRPFPPGPPQPVPNPDPYPSPNPYPTPSRPGTTPGPNPEAPPVEEPAPDPDEQPAPGPAPEPEPDDDPDEDPSWVPAPDPLPPVIPTPEPIPIPDPGPVPNPFPPGPQPQPEPTPLPNPDPIPQPGPVPVPDPDPTPEPVPVPNPDDPDVDPVVPEPIPIPDPGVDPVPGPVPGPFPVPIPITPNPAPIPIPEIPPITEPSPDPGTTPVPEPGTFPDPFPDPDPEPMPLPQPQPLPTPTQPQPGTTPETAIPTLPDGNVSPEPEPALVPTDPNTHFPTPGVPGVTPGGTRPDLNSIANEVGRIEQKVARLQRGEGGNDLSDWLWLLPLLQDFFETPIPGTTYQLEGFCECVEPGEPQPVKEFEVEPAKNLGAVINRLDTIDQMLQQHLEWKTPTCKPCKPLAGDWRTISFISDDVSPFGKSRLRKRFRYRSLSGLGLSGVIDHWKDFVWEAGPVCVQHADAYWGTPQCWAASVDEGKRVIRHAAGEAGLDPDKDGRWVISGSDSPRVGVPGTMRVNRAGGYYWITARDGSEGRPLVGTIAPAP